MSNSAVNFATLRRVHIGLAVSDVEHSKTFYQTLLGAEPTKVRDGYARFETEEPPLNLSILQSEKAQGPADPTSHFGIQVKSTTAVEAMKRRLESLGLATRTEDSVNCCHAVQDKIWVVDPDGYRWEVFVVLDDEPSCSTSCTTESTSECCSPADAEPCCAPRGETCC